MPYELEAHRTEYFNEVPYVPPVPLTASQYEKLYKNRESRLAASTIRAYDTALRQWQKWCWRDNLTWFPAHPYYVALWLSELSDAGMRVETLKQKAKALSYIHRERGADDPTKDQVVADAIRACPLGWQSKKAAAVGEESFAAMLGVASRRDRALLLCMRWLMLRPSEAAALRWDDIDKDRSLVCIRHSKTDQRGEGVWMHLPPNVRLGLAEYRRHLGRNDRNRVSVFGLTANSVSRVVRRIALKAGLTGVSGHSLRRGMACDLVRRGETVTEIMVAGRWESPSMVARYADEVAATGALARYAEEE